MRKNSKVKGIVCLMVTLFLFAIGTTANPVHAKDKGVEVTPNSVVVCPVHGSFHAPSTTSGIKFAFSKGGTVYNGQLYTCECGAQIFYSKDLPGANYYWFNGTWYWAMPYYVPNSFQYIVPSPLYTLPESQVNPPYWQIYYWGN